MQNFQGSTWNTNVKGQYDIGCVTTASYPVLLLFYFIQLETRRRPGKEETKAEPNPGVTGFAKRGLPHTYIQFHEHERPYIT